MSQSSDVARANRKPFWSKAGSPVPAAPVPTSEAGLTGYNGEGVLNPHNNDRASRIPDRAPEATQFHRGRMTAEAGGPRLSISPSDKIPTDDLPSGYNSSVKLVSSRGGQGNPGVFTEAQYSAQHGL